MLEIRHLTKRFGGVAAMDDVTLSFESESISAVIGPNGAGKSTFFNLISGAITPDRGTVELAGEDVTGLPPAALIRKGMARAFQVARIFPTLTVEENLMAVVATHRRQYRSVFGAFPAPRVRERAMDVASMLGLTAKAKVVASELSHGDQKLLDIAMALALEPRVLLLDEPIAGMGSEERWKMIEQVYALWKSERMTLVFIEHDMDIVFKYAPKICVLSYGKVLAQGSPEEIRNNEAVITAYLGHEEQPA